MIKLRKKLLALVLITFSVSCGSRSNAPETEVADEVSETGMSKETEAETAENFAVENLLGYNSEEDLKKAFGDSNIKRSVDEKFGLPMTVLFPGTSRESHFYWSDESGYKDLNQIVISSNGTGLKTKEGIFIGMTMRELEKINKKPFVFYGFYWDYAGSLIDWKGGAIPNSERDLFVTFANPEYLEDSSMTGEVEISSDAAGAQELNPKVGEIRIMRSQQAM